MTTPSLAWLGGAPIPFSEAKVPIEDRGLQLGESLYEVVAITAGKPRLLPEHIMRMRSGAHALGIEHGVPAISEWERIVETLAKADGVAEGTLYAQLTGGTAPRRHVPDERVEPAFFAYVRPARFPREAEARRGVSVIVLEDPRWARRNLKTTMLLPAVLAKRAARERGADEALFRSPEGRLFEGASSNVCLVERTRVVTPEQTSNLLPGVTRPLVGDVARDAGLSFTSEPVTMDRLLSADEVFLSSTSQLAMPVLRIDDRPVGRGEAGTIALELARRIREKWELL